MYYIWETSKNNLKKHSVRKKNSQKFCKNRKIVAVFYNKLICGHLFFYVTSETAQFCWNTKELRLENLAREWKKEGAELKYLL